VNAVSEVSQELYTSTINEIIKQVPELGSQACEEIVFGSLHSYSGINDSKAFITWGTRLCRSAWYLELFVKEHLDAIVAALNSFKTLDKKDHSPGDFLVDLCGDYDQLTAVLNAGPPDQLGRRLSEAAREWGRKARNQDALRRRSSVSIDQAVDRGDERYTPDTLAQAGFYDGEGGSVPRRVVAMGRSKKKKFVQLSRDKDRRWLLEFLEVGGKPLDEVKLAAKAAGIGAAALTTARSNADFQECEGRIQLSDFGERLLRLGRELEYR
jgi:hypothetical protein